jgi:hypothetical protein
MASVSIASKSTRSRRAASNTEQKQMINFHFEGVAYVLDLERNKVYRNWMAVETNKGFGILGAYRNSAAIPA